MKQFKTFLISFLLFSTFTEAQEYTVKWGPLMDISKTDVVDDLIYADKNQMTISRKNIKTRTFTAIEKYNKDFKLVYTKDLTSVEKGTSLLNASFTGEKYLNLFSVYNSKAKTKKYSVMTMGDEVNSKVKEWTIATVDLSEKGSGYTSSFYNSPDYKKKVYLLENQFSNFKNTRDKEFIIVVLNEQGEKLWQKTITNKGVPSSHSNIIDLAVNNNGDVLLVEKRLATEDGEYKGSRFGMFKNLEYDNNLYLFTNNGNDYNKVNVELGDYNIRSVRSEVNQENDNFQFAGMYSNGKRGIIQGVFFGEINSKGQIVKSNQKNYSDSFLDSFKKGSTGKERGEDDEGLSENFLLRKFLTREDGGAYLVFEYYRLVVITTTTSTGKTSTRYSYQYKDIIVTSVDPSGKIDWNYRIPKYQISSGTIFSSIVPFINGNKLGIIYNENPKNLEKEFEDKFSKVNFKECVAVVRTLDPKGNLTSDVLFKNKEFNILLQPSMCKQTSPKTLAIYGGKFGLLSFKDARLGTVEF